MKILFLFAHLHRGGMQRAVSNISCALEGEFEQYIGFFGTDAPGFPFGGVLHDFGLPPTASGNSLLGKGLNALRRLRALRKYVAANGIDAVISFGEAANLYSLLARHSAKTLISVRVAIDEHLGQLGIYARLLNALVGLAYPRTDRVICVSNALASYVAGRWPRLASRTVVINNLYDLSAIRKSAALDLPDQYQQLVAKKFILAVGSITFQKGHDLLIEAFSLLRSYVDAQLVLIGSGDLGPSLLEQATRLGVADRLTLIEFDSNPYRYMARATVFVLSSRFEGFPNVLLEAMACGTPVVAYDCPTGPREILGESEFGVLVRDMTPAALANGIGRVLASAREQARFKRLALERSEDFGIDRIRGQWTRLLRSVVQ